MRVSPIKNWRNVLTLKDERTRTENWFDEITLIDLSEIQDSWNKTCQSLPLYDTWKRVREEIISVGKGKGKQKCRVIGYHNDELTVIFQNYYPEREIKTYDLTANNNLAIYFQGKLYFIELCAYISVKRLIVQVTCYQDYVFTNLPDLLTSSGHGIMKQSTFFKDQKGLHYSFCGDVGDKVTFRDKAQWQPTFRAVKLRTDFWESDAMLGGIHYKQIGGDANAHIPTATKLDDLGTSSADWKDTSTLSFLGPGEMSAKEIENMSFRTYPNQKFTLPEELRGEPHLWEHAKVQFFFLNDMIYEADMTDLDIREGNPAIDLPKSSGYNVDPRNKRIKISKYLYINYHIFVNASPAGIIYRFESKSIRFRWSLKVGGEFKPGKLSGLIWKGIDIAASFIMKSPHLQARSVHEAFKQSGIDMEANHGRAQEDQQGTRQSLTTHSSEVKTGEGGAAAQNMTFTKDPLVMRRVSREGHSTSSGIGANIRMVKPSVLYSNTINFDHSYPEFANRYSTPMFIIGVQYSANQYNNLRNNINSPQIISINTPFDQFGKLIKSGFLQGDFVFYKDVAGNFFAELMRRGTTFYDTWGELKKKPLMEWRRPKDFILVPYDNSRLFHNFQETKTTIDRKTFNYDYEASKRIYSHGTYVYVDNQGEEDALARSHPGLQLKSHYHPSSTNLREPGWCWGCTFDDLERSNFLQTDSFFTPSSNCNLIMKLDEGPATTKQLIAGKRYRLNFSPQQLILDEETTVNINITTENTPQQINPEDLKFKGDQLSKDITGNLNDTSGIELIDPALMSEWKIQKEQDNLDYITSDVVGGGSTQQEIIEEESQEQQQQSQQQQKHDEQQNQDSGTNQTEEEE